MSGYNDPTLGSQTKTVLGGLVAEFGFIDFSNDISLSTVVPTNLERLLGWVGHVSVCADAGCVSAGFGKPLTNMSLCEGPVLEISANDITVGTQTSEAKMTYIAWGW